MNFTNNNSSFGGDFSGFSFANTNLNMDGSDQFQSNGQAQNGLDLNSLNAYLQNNLRNNQGVNWTTCNHCQQLFANNDYAQHESTCPMRPQTNDASGINLQLQQYLQLQQNNINLQQQFEQQQAQLNQQFQEQQAQLNTSHHQQAAFSALASMGGDNMQMSNAPHCMPALPKTNNYQGLNALQQGIEMNESADGITRDQFDALVNQLPAFNPPAASANNAVLSPPPESNSTEYFPLALTPEDEKWLTPLHCFVRQYCAEVFVATSADVEAPCMGKRSPVTVGQVGIRCPYCSPKNEETRAAGLGYDVARARENGVVFPSIVSRIYNATINLLQRHLRTCSFVPPAVLAKYDELKASNARSGASKKYWVESALRMGLYDTPDGIRLNKEMYLQTKMDAKRCMVPQAGGFAKADATVGEDSNAPPLVLPTDKRYTTAFTFHLMAQMQPCVFTEADRLGRRRNLEVGFAGLACRHCFGGHGNGRFFPSSIKTMSDASKTLDAIYKHIRVCGQCPQDIKQGLANLKEFHDSEKSKMPFGNQRAFFARIWSRLHDNDKASMSDSTPFEDSKPAALDNTVLPKLEGDSSDSLQALYAQLSRNNATMKKLVNEAA
ncbi:hypothetical protein ACHAWO_011118 [Cyclotella atomus]|uniref:C2H2-type domain-containing protein n=1 Tax=Cyclotella atomus TaxID=382360 RepID=A0ABD3MNC7_9STRA